EDRHGDVWVSTFGDDRVLRWSRASERLEPVAALHKNPTGTVTAFGEDAAGDLWLGFYDGGLMRFDGSRWRRFGPADGLPPGSAEQVPGAAAGRRGVAAGGAPVRVDDPARAAPLTAVAVTAAGDGPGVRCLLPVGAGELLWLGTKGGLFLLEPASGRSTRFG